MLLQDFVNKFLKIKNVSVCILGKIDKKRMSHLAGFSLKGKLGEKGKLAKKIFSDNIKWTSKML